jgi:hypothetical protein
LKIFQSGKSIIQIFALRALDLPQPVEVTQAWSLANMFKEPLQLGAATNTGIPKGTGTSIGLQRRVTHLLLRKFFLL